jgi:hypothetical protein
MGGHTTLMARADLGHDMQSGEDLKASLGTRTTPAGRSRENQEPVVGELDAS